MIQGRKCTTAPRSRKPKAPVRPRNHPAPNSVPPRFRPRATPLRSIQSTAQLKVRQRVSLRPWLEKPKRPTLVQPNLPPLSSAPPKPQQSRPVPPSLQVIKPALPGHRPAALVLPHLCLSHHPRRMIRPRDLFLRLSFQTLPMPK